MHHPPIIALLSHLKLLTLCPRSPREQDGEAMGIGAGQDMLSTTNPDADVQEEAETPIYEKYNALLHGNMRSKK